MNKYLKRLPVLLAGAGSALYLILIFNNNLWMDEAFTACLVRGSFREMLDRSFSDTLPPLYNLTAWCMTQVFGYNSVILKLTSVLPMVLLMFFSAFKLPSLFRESTASLFILCLITAPHMVHYGVEIRMYGMAMAFATIAAIFACECTVKTGFGPWLQFSVFTALAGYTHHFGLIADAFVWLALFISILAVKRHLLLSWLKAAGLTFVLYLPGLLLTLRQIRGASSYFSASEVTLKNFLSSFRYPFVTNVTALSACLLLLVLISLATGFSRWEGVCFIPVYAAVLVLSYLSMLLTGTSFFSARYLFPSLGMLWLGFSVCITFPAERIPLRFRQFLLYGSIILLAAVGCVTYSGQFREEYAPGVGQMLSFSDANLTPGDGYVIYEDNYQIELCMRYYEPDLTKCDWDSAGRIGGNLWYFAVPGFEDRLDEASARGYNAKYIGEMSFDQYSFSLYQLIREEGD